MTKKKAKGNKNTNSGKAELTETQLEEISGGPHFRTFDDLRYDFQGVGQKVRLPVSSVRFNKI